MGIISETMFMKTVSDRRTVTSVKGKIKSYGHTPLCLAFRLRILGSRIFGLVPILIGSHDVSFLADNLAKTMGILQITSESNFIGKQRNSNPCQMYI